MLVNQHNQIEVRAEIDHAIYIKENDTEIRVGLVLKNKNVLSETGSAREASASSSRLEQLTLFCGKMIVGIIMSSDSH